MYTIKLYVGNSIEMHSRMTRDCGHAVQYLLMPISLYLKCHSSEPDQRPSLNIRAALSNYWNFFPRLFCLHWVYPFWSGRVGWPVQRVLWSIAPIFCHDCCNKGSRTHVWNNSDASSQQKINCPLADFQTITHKEFSSPYSTICSRCVRELSQNNTTVHRKAHSEWGRMTRLRHKISKGGAGS